MMDLLFCRTYTNDHSKPITDHKLLSTNLALDCFHYSLTFFSRISCITGDISTLGRREAQTMPQGYGLRFSI